MSKRSKVTRLAKRAWRAWGARGVALVLTVVMCAEAMLGNGVSVALAQGIEQTLEYQSTAQRISDANNVSESDAKGNTDGNVMSSDATDPESDVIAQDDENTLGGSSNNLNNGLADSSTENGSTTTENGDGNTGNTNNGGGQTGNGDGDSANGQTGNSDGAGDNGQTGNGNEATGNGQTDTGVTGDGAQSTVQERTEIRAWEGDLDALTLTSTGLAVSDTQDAAAQAVSAIVEAAAQQAADATDTSATEAADTMNTDGATSTDTADSTTTSTETDTASSDDAPAQDPYADVMVEATLNLTLTLDPTKSQTGDASERAAVIAGDTLTVKLPEGITPADPAQTFDVYQRDAEGNPTTIKIAEAAFVDGALKLTFVTPVDDAGTTYVVGAAPEVAEGETALQQLATLDATLDMDVTFPLSRAEAEASQLTWTLQTKTGVAAEEASVEAGTAQEAALEIPARADLEALVGILADGPEAEADTTEVEPATEEESEETPVEKVESLMANLRVTLETTTTYQVSLNEQVSSIITWCDNNYGSRPSTDSLENGFIPYYAVQGTDDYKPLIEKDQDGRWHITDAAMKELHLDGYEQLLSTLPLVDITQTATNTYEVLSHALPGEVTTTVKSPSLDKDGNPIYNEDGEQTFYYDSKTMHYDWKLVDTNTYPGYVDGTNSKWDHQYKMLTSDVEFNVIGKVGGEKLSNIFGDAEADDFRFSASIDNKPVKQDISVAEAIEQGLLEITDGPDGTTCVVSGTLPVYDENGYPIVYYIQYTGEQNTDDYYQPTYDNSASANHSSDTAAVYSGGTMTLRHAGTTEYYGTKQWLDDGDYENRPAAVFTLWRYSTNGGTAATASQVQLENAEGTTQEPTVPPASNSVAAYVTVTIPAGAEASTVDLHQLLVDTYGDAINQLPKYDPDGYPYVYALREEAVQGYEQVYGQVTADGSVNDTPPTYEGADGNWVRYDSDERPSNDHFIYNGGDEEGEGVISNRVTGTTTTEMTKSWEIAAFQDDLQDVVCEFTAQCRTVDPDDGDDWVNVDADNAVQTITGWNAETLVKTITGTFPKYDAHGNELEYRWVESNVTLEGQTTNFKSDGNGGGTFTIDMVDAEGNPETLEFTSKPTTTVGDDGFYSTDIVNTFNNITYQRVDKYWEQPDGTLAQIAPDPAYDDGVAKMELYQDGVLIGTFELDGKTDTDATPVKGIDGATWQETSSYHGDFENLPKYSPDGVRYNYLVLEVTKPNWHTDRTYDPDTRTTRIDNYFPEGEGSEIRVTKYWLDGDDAAHRLKVRAQLVALKDMESKAKDENGDPLYKYDAGDPVEWIDDDGEVQTTFDLTSAELWYAEIDVPIGGLNYKDFEVREVALVDDRGTEDPADDIEYPVLTHDEALIQHGNEAWVNAAWTNPENRRVATDQHVYEVKSRYNESMRSCEITNRRLGLLDITVRKEWKDGLGADEDGTRPEATLTLSCLEYDNAFSLNDEGNLQVSVSGNTLAITDADGNPVKATIVNDDDGDGHGSAQVTVNTSEATSEYVFKGLPKYDADGLNVHYTVEEDWTGSQGDYRSSKTKDEYTVKPNERHFQDTQDIDFVNSRTGTRDVVFYKNWHDAYVNDTLKQRPDIYLTLWQVSGDNEPKQVDGYTHFTWSAADEGGDATNNQKVTITDLPKYDSEGYEITYYATETMSADGTSLGYGDATFDYTTIDSSVPENERAIKVDDQAASLDESTVGWALHEDGTFVNTLEGTLTANGTKLWENIPGNVLQTDLPEVTVYLQQKLADDAGWPDMYLVKDDGGEWVVKEGAVAETSELKETATNQYTYTITADYDGEALPRYDENGNLYQYRAVEVIWGLYNQPGGFTDKELDPDNDGTSINLTDVREGAGEDNPLNKHIFIIQHGETGSFLLRNIYSTGTDKGNLTVKKLFGGRDTTDGLYPDVTYTVYRYYLTGDGEKSAAQAVASHTITQADFQASTTGETGNHSATYTFENLEVYAPDGSLWIYYVTETDINGYETTVGVGDLALESDQLKEGTDADGATQSPDLGTFQDGKITASVLEDDSDVDVTFANTYNPDSANLKGTKKWDDFNNIFSVRPTEKLDLTFTRTAGGLTEDVTTQSDNSDQPNYLVWTAFGEIGDWTFELNNIEKWAPNGQAWTYTVTEKLPSGAENYYTIVTGTSQVASTSTTGFKLENALNGQATVEKNWVDGGDPYGLRPETVTVELQARYVKVDGSGTVQGNYSEWKNAYEVWKNFASETDLNNQGFTVDSVTRTLQASNGWKGSWQKLPLIARLNVDSDLNKIEYRVVETKIGDKSIDSPDANGAYVTYHPYQPSQTTTTSEDGVKSSTSITNTLESTSVQATKSWSNDTVNNVEDAWGTRPADGNNWVATFFLQQRLEGAGDDVWAWVVETGAEPATSAADDGVVSFTISNGMTGDENHVVVKNDDSVTVTWKNLPDCDENGVKYEYRIVEQVPGSYDVKGAEQVEDTDTAHRYYVVTSTVGTGDNPDSQSFDNELRTVNLTGTKKWNDYGTGFAPAFDSDNTPKMVLYRQVGDDTTTAEKVTMKDGSNPAQPRWADNGDGTWTFTYTGLPAADENDQAYTYWAEEQAGSGNADGFYPTYGTADGAGTTAGNGAQTNTDITNVATRFTLDKLSDWNGSDGNPERLNGIELSVVAGGKTYAVWERDANGNVTTWVYPEGGATKGDVKIDAHKMDGDAAGYIVGLHDDTYTIAETGTVPAGYAKAPDVSITISADGKVTSTTQGAVENGDKPGVDAVITVDVVDPVLRGHLELTKLVSENGLETDTDKSALKGATFDLYRVDCDNDGEDELIAEDLTSDANGKVTTVGKTDVSINKWSSKGENVGVDLTYGGKYTKLSDGLPEGEYYFLETNATPGAVLPTGEAAKSDGLEITQNTHYATTKAPVKKDMGNEEFGANISLMKRDADSGTDPLAGISGATFQLEYKAEGSTGDYVKLGSYSTDKNGLLSISDLEKGDYRLTETSNKGYVVTDENRFIATFTLEDKDDDRVFDVDSKGAWDAIDFTVVQGELLDGSGVLNHRQTGQVTLNKRGNSTAIDATFELQMKVGDEWKTVASDLETGNSYELAFNDDGVTATATDSGDLSTGQMKVTGLTWNTYRFQETKTVPGYLPEKGNGPVTSSEFTINRNNAASTNVGVTVQNAQTELRINKQSPTGEALNGAKFTVTPVGNSKFANPTALGKDYDAETGAITLTTEKSGYATLKCQLVVGGTYEIYEVAGPSGYDPVDESFRVFVEDNGRLKVVDDQGQETELPDGYQRTDIDGADTDAFSFIATNQPMAIKLTKVSSVDDGLLLEGATFRLIGKVMFDNDTTHTDTTDENGNIDIMDGLMGGVKYTLIEDQAPAGYITEAAEPITFYMDDRGEIDVDGELPEGWTVNGDKISFTAENEPVELQITKRAPDNEDGTEGKLLDGATFTVTPVGSTTFADGSTDPVEMVTEDGTARITAQLLVGGTYDITETKAPDGFELVEGIMRVEVDEHGNINPIGSVDDSGAVVGQLPPAGYSRVDSDGDGTPDNAFEVKVVNQPIEISLVKVNRDDTTSRLPGATFEIAPLDGSKFADGTTAAKQFTTGDEGTLEVSEELAYGNAYTIREVEAPNGFELIEGELTFSVAENGEISAEGEVPEGYAIEPSGVTISASDKPIEVGFDKKGLDSDESLVGGEFTISGTFVDDATHELSEQKIDFTTEGRVFSFAGIEHDGATYSLVAGETYTLTETKAPGGYELLDPFTFTVDEQGGISAAAGSQTAAEGEEGYTISEQDGVVTLAAYDTPIEVKLTKTSSANAQLTLPDAEFELYIGESVDGGTRFGDTLTTEKSGTVELTGLVGGTTYTLHETKAPEGYELLPDVTFTVEVNGEVTFVGAHDGFEITSQDGVVTITAEDDPIEAAIMKVDDEGNPLAGAIFTVTGKFAGTASDKEERTLEASDAEGVAVIPSATLVAGEHYTLTEVTAPEGYELAGSVTFTVNEDGTLTLEGTTDAGTTVETTDGSGTYTASAEGGTAIITATDTLTELTIYKAAATEDEEGDPSQKTYLAGAEFTLTEVVPEDSEGTGDTEGTTPEPHVLTGTTDENGSLVLTGLKAGATYTLAETLAPAGYELLTDTLTIEVAPDGTVEVTGGNASGAYTLNAEGIAIEVMDRYLGVSLVKTDLTGTALKGATFTLKPATGTFPDGTTEKTFTSDEFGAVFTGLQLAGSAEGTAYVLTETQAPEGYEMAAPVTFLVFEDGTVGLPSTLDADAAKRVSIVNDGEDGIAVITLANKPEGPPLGEHMSDTGDHVMFIAGAMGVLALACIAGGLELTRRKR